MGRSRSNQITLITALAHTHSLISLNVIYSASSDEAAIVGCNFDDHAICSSAANSTLPVVNFLESRSPVQSIGRVNMAESELNTTRVNVSEGRVNVE